MDIRAIFFCAISLVLSVLLIFSGAYRIILMHRGIAPTGLFLTVWNAMETLMKLLAGILAVTKKILLFCYKVFDKYMSTCAEQYMQQQQASVIRENEIREQNRRNREARIFINLPGN